MKKYDPHKKDKEQKCDVCKTIVLIDRVGNSDPCPICGWMQNEEARDRPWIGGLHNIASLNTAKTLYKQGMPIKPSFSDFVDAVRVYGEMQFTLEGQMYNTRKGKSGTFEMIGVNDQELLIFSNIQDFEKNAKIKGQLLKDLWDRVKDPYFLQ